MCKKTAIQLSDHFTYKKLIRFCMSPIIMMVFTSVYGVVDGFFVSNFVGKNAFAAINLVMPFLLILGGMGYMIGTGGSALVAKTLGENDREKSNRYFTMMVTLSVIVGAVLTIIGILFIRPISVLLGATDAVLGDCVTYGRIILLFIVPFTLQNVFQTFLTTAEKPKLGLGVTVAAGVTNMVLDFLFIAVFQWGVAGAALATGIAASVGGIVPLIYFLRPNTSLLRLTGTKLEGRALLRACTNGSSEFINNISGSLVSILYNFQLIKFAGADGVAAYGVLMYVQFVFIAIFIGYTIGTAPVIGYHYGAANHKELKSMLKKSTVLTGLTGAAMTALAWLLADPIARVFVGYDADLCAMTRHGFNVMAFSFLLIGVNIFISSFFTALNNGAVSAVISFLRTVVFQTLCVLLFPILFGLDGIWWAITAAEVFAFIISVICVFAKRKTYHYL